MNMKLRIWALAIAMALLSVAPAQAAKECPPLTVLPGYHARDGGVALRAYDAIKVRADGKTDSGFIPAAGSTCTGLYAPDDGTSPLEDAAIQGPYRAALAKLGATLIYTDETNTTAELKSGAADSFFVLNSDSGTYSLTIVNVALFAATLTKPAKTDDKLLGHMPNYAISGAVINGDDGTTEFRRGDEVLTISGKQFHAIYTIKPGKQLSSDLEIQSNFRAAFAALGAQLFYEDATSTYARLETADKTKWLKVTSEEGDYTLDIIDEQPIAPPPPDNALKDELDANGHVALYVNFDFNKSTLKPDAKPMLAQVVKLMSDEPELKLSVEGDTDNIGTDEYNLKLSADRAASVVAALIAEGVAADRVTPSGAGASSPIADNATPEGRAKNRRVELTKAN
jgi:outer membrane protein OmpA-like peptidoglycan-associated protein